MKIALVNNFFYDRGGSERVLLDEKAWLESQGISVFPFAQNHPETMPTEWSAYFPPRLEYSELPFLSRTLAAPGIVYSRTARRLFAAFLEQVRPDLIHAHNIYGGLTTAVLDAAAQRRIPVVMTLHDYKLVCPAYTCLNQGKPCLSCGGVQFWRCLVHRCHKNSLAASVVYTIEAYYSAHKYAYPAVFICPSRFLLNLVAPVVGADKAVYLPNGAVAAATSGTEENPPYLLFAGRLCEEKGLLTLLDAMRGSNLRLRIAGSGPLGPALRRRLEESGSRNVVWEGRLDKDGVRRALRGCAAAVVPSLWYENCPLAVLEAMSEGKPVIASAAGGVPEMVSHNVNGLLFPPGDSQALATCIEEIMQSEARRREMGEEALRCAREKLSLQKHCGALLDIYRSVLNGTRPEEKIDENRISCP